ncbi:DUF6230 family protein [Streptomyces sp. NPDC002004]
MLHRSGRTRWKRFAAVLVSCAVATTALGIAMAQGALAASFFISGQRFQFAADTLNIRGLSIYSMVDVTRRGSLVPVVVTGARHAKISGLCESVVVDIPALGPYTLRLTGGDRSRAEAQNMFIDATSVAAGQADLDSIDVGVAAGAVTEGPIAPGDRHSRFFDPDGIAQQAEAASLTDVQATVVAFSAGTFTIPGLDVRVRAGRHECF